MSRSRRSRPPWVAAVLEVGMSDGSLESLRIEEGVTRTDNVIAHVMDVGANYWSLWNWHRERPENVLAYHRQYPGMIDTMLDDLVRLGDGVWDTS